MVLKGSFGFRKNHEVHLTDRNISDSVQGLQSDLKGGNIAVHKYQLNIAVHK